VLLDLARKGRLGDMNDTCGTAKASLADDGHEIA
jgi:hypothetical protein